MTIRQSEEDNGVTYGTGDNNYIIQANIFTYGLSDAVLTQIAKKVYRNVKGVSFRPFKSINNGLPWVECGLDAVTYYVTDPTGTGVMKMSDSKEEQNVTSFYVFDRELKGIQALSDSYSAQGDEYQSEFITDLQTQIDTLKKKQSSGITKPEMEDYAYSRDEIDDMLANSEPGGDGGTPIVSVKVLPEKPDLNVIYLVEGEVVIN